MLSRPIDRKRPKIHDFEAKNAYFRKKMGNLWGKMIFFRFMEMRPVAGIADAGAGQGAITAPSPHNRLGRQPARSAARS
jgi:hypothetical protein